MQPDYYKEFTCIADQCSFTCCREWKIGVDDVTFKKWKHTCIPDGMYEESLIRQNVADCSNGVNRESCVQKRQDLNTKEKKLQLSEYVIKKDGSRVIGLNEEKNCPFLNEKKLCRLVLAYGDEILSQTCQIFPRELHTFNEDVTEYSLMPSCPAVVDLLWKRDHISFSGEMDASAYRGLAPLVNLRAFLMKLMEDDAHTPEHDLMKIFYVLLDLYERVEKEPVNDAVKSYPDGFLEELSKTIDDIEQNPQYSIEERNELFLDLAENYRREGLYEKYLEPVAQLAEQLSEQGIKEEVVKEWQEFEVHFLKYQPLMRRFLLMELYADSLKPEGNIEEMVVQVQWIAMEYATIRHAVFLYWLLGMENKFSNGKSISQEALAYENLREYIVVISRMMGYEEEDIYEYLENSFEDIIWDWGYFALICS